MKTTKIRLLATIITLAVVTTFTIIPANAQRRSTGKQITESRKKSDSSRKSIVKKRSTFKNYDKVERTPQNSPAISNWNIKGKLESVSSHSSNRNSKRQKTTQNSISNKNREIVSSGKAQKNRRNIKERSDYKRIQNTNLNLQRNRRNVGVSRSNTNSNPARVSNRNNTNRYSSSRSRREISTMLLVVQNII